MRKALLLLSLFLLSCAPNHPVTTTPGQTIINRFDTVAALVIETDAGYRPYCSGVFIEQYVLTAAHCVTNDDGSVDSVVEIGTFRDYNQEEWTFPVTHTFHPVQVWEGEDAALLAPDNLFSLLHHGSAAVSAVDVTYADAVSVFGNPARYFYYFSRGEVVSPYRHTPVDQINTGMPFTLINAVVYPGMSGGPVFNDAGEVVGLVSWGWRRGAWNVVGIVHRTSLEGILAAR